MFEQVRCEDCGRTIADDEISYYAPDIGGIVCSNCKDKHNV